MSKHTPGPWAAEKRLTTEISIRSAERTVIAGARCDSYLPADEAAANARLIAAAPDLLAACKETLAELAEYSMSNLSPETRQKIASAIAKAEAE